MDKLKRLSFLISIFLIVLIVVMACKSTEVQEHPSPAVTTSEEATAQVSKESLEQEVIIGNIDAEVKSHLQKILERGQDNGMRSDVFAKIGDSITASRNFLVDIGCGQYDLGSYGYLKDVIDFYSATMVDTESSPCTESNNSFTRQSLSAVSGWTSVDALEGGANSALYREIRALRPRLAIIMYGTNDLARGADIQTFKGNLEQIISILEQEGIIPILSTIPDMVSLASRGDMVSIFNSTIREIAQERNIPLIDYWLALQPLPNKGLSQDGIHPSVYMRDGKAEGGYLTEEALQYGYNMRNLTFLQMLSKIRHIVIEDNAPDSEASEK